MNGTIAHGFLTLATLSKLRAEIWEIEGTRKAFNKLRFPAPVPTEQQSGWTKPCWRWKSGARGDVDPRHCGRDKGRSKAGRGGGMAGPDLL